MATDLADRHGGPVDVFGHSIGAVCVLGAAAAGASFRRIALYELPGPETVPRDWIDRATEMVAAGEHGRAMGSFLIEVIGLTLATVATLRDFPVAHESLEIVAGTLVREAEALATLDIAGWQPMSSSRCSSSWEARVLTGPARSPSSSPGHCTMPPGHTRGPWPEGVDTAPRHLSAELAGFLSR